MLAFSVSVAAHAGVVATALLVALLHDHSASIELPHGDASEVRVFLVAVGDTDQSEASAAETEFEAPVEVLEAIGITEPSPQIPPPAPPPDQIEPPPVSAMTAAASEFSLPEDSRVLENVRDQIARMLETTKREAVELARSIRREAVRLADQAARAQSAMRMAAMADEADVASMADSGILHGPVAASANKAPKYPDEARRRGQAGVVLLHFEIGDDGRVVHVAVARSSGFELLDRAAADAARSWRFKPAVENGVPVASEANLPVEFVMK